MVEDRSSSEPEQPFTLISGDLVIDLARRAITRQGRPVSLSKLEFDLLAHLVQQRCRVTPCDELLDQVWGYPPDNGDPVQVRNAVRRLRKKLGDDAGCPRYVVTVRGVGYRWEEAVRLASPEESNE
jgi:two-component system alkaline phosphatase synthesis response regulator PhoP